MDGAMYPDGWHAAAAYKDRSGTKDAKPFTRIQKPPKYYFIDFGISHKFGPKDAQRLALPIMGGDRTAPELQGQGGGAPRDPFPTDIDYLGNVVCAGHGPKGTSQTSGHP